MEQNIILLLKEEDFLMSKEIGIGTHATVYRYEHPETKKIYALKVFRE